jgi:LPXTG-site transpeptidase (sortase) family protein
MPPSRLQIASLKIDAPTIYVSGTTETVFQKALERGIVHLPGTANPGEAGNAYYFGHSSDYPWKAGAYKTVFAMLPNIKIDDTVLISDADDHVFRYRVINTLIVKPRDVSVVDQHEQNVHMMTLQTSYPLGSALRRFIVQTELQEQVDCEPSF